MGTPLDAERYVSLETYRKDGSAARTPVWAAPWDGKLVVYTEAATYKARRLVDNPKLRLAACNGNGKKVREPWYAGTARIVPLAEAPAQADALARKYGWQWRAFRGLSRLFGRTKAPIILEVTLD